MVYSYLGGILASDAGVSATARVVRFEDLLAAPAETLRGLLEHCRLPDVEGVLSQFVLKIHRQDYYQRGLSPADLAVIREETADTASAWGYS